MVGAPESLKSATLQPPRKSIELEDPGAHDLGRASTFCYGIDSAYVPLREAN